MKNQYKDSQYVLSEEQVFQLLNASRDLREKVIIGSAYFAGLRRFEIGKMRAEDVDFQFGDITVLGKGNKISPVPVGSLFPQYLSDLKHYIAFTNRKEGYLFSKNGKRPLCDSRINQLFNEVGEIAGLKHPNKKPKNIYVRAKDEKRVVDRKINPHLLRHSLARHLKRQGYRGEFIQNYLRHEKSTTTWDEYGTLSIQEMRHEALERRGVLEYKQIN